jgi:hypothetical protein
MEKKMNERKTAGSGFLGLVFFLVSGLFVLQAVGAQLDDFEASAGKKRSGSSAPSRPPRFHGYDYYDGFWSPFFLFPYYRRDDDPARYRSGDGGTNEWDAMVHSLGVPALPYVRTDYNWQYLNANLMADDVRLEAGYKLLAFQGRHTRYVEKNPSDELEVGQYYCMIRVGGEEATDTRQNWWEIGMGLGGMQQRGNSEFSSWAAAVVIKIYPAEWIGFEFRPAWYSPQERTIGDYDLSASLGWRFVQFRGGYRWIWIQGVGHDLNGPYVGASVSF